MILLNDTFLKRDAVHIDLEDRGYQFGDGVYEVIRIYDGHLFQIDEHLERLEASCEKIKLEQPNTQKLKQQLTKLVNDDGVRTGIVYLQITRGQAPRTHEFPANDTGSILTAYTKEMERPMKKIKEGIGTILTDDVRWLRCDIKSLNLLGNVMAKQDAVEQQCGEAIFNRDGVITEGSSSNVFIVRDEHVYTHPANNLILNGITRQKVLALLDDLGYTYFEETFTPKELFSADEVFITSTTSEVSPVKTIDGQKINNGDVGAVTKALQTEFEKGLHKW